MIHIYGEDFVKHFDTKEAALEWTPKSFPAFLLGDETADKYGIHNRAEYRQAVESAVQTDAGKRVAAVIVKMREGGRVVGDDQLLDALDAFDYAETDSLGVRSCCNRKRIGTRDTYVMWISNPPSDLEQRANYAIGSA